MKPNAVKMYQAGSYITYQPIPAVPPQQQQVEAQEEAPTSKKGKDDDGPLSKELVGKLLGEGLTNDVMKYSQLVNNAYQQYSAMSDLEKSTYKGRQLRQVMKGDLGQLNALVRGRKQLEDSMAVAKSNSALDELAVTAHGMVVKDSSGKITTVSFQDYAKDNNQKQKSYQALTNAQLANAREYDDQLIGNSNVFSIIDFGRGLDKVKEEVYAVMSSISSSSNSVSNGGYTTEGDTEDMKALATAASNGVFKMKEGQTDTTNSLQIAKAKRLLWYTLKDNSKAVLRARAATQVQDPAQIEAQAMNLAASLLDPHEYSIHREVNDLSVPKGGGKGSANGESPTEFGPTQAAFNARSNHDSMTTISPEGLKMEGHIYALPNFNYTNAKNERTTLQNAGKMDQIARTDQAFTMNGDAVNRNNTVITGGAYYTTLPVKYNSAGVMEIDRDGAKKYAQVEDEFKRLPQSQQTPLKLSELRSKYGANNLNLRKLVVAEAMSYGDKYLDGRDEKYYSKVTDKQTKQYVGDIVDPKETGVRSWLDNSLYKHLIFMPAKDELSARYADGHEATVPKYTVDARTFNTGNNGANISDGQPFAQSVKPPTNYTSSAFD